MTEQLAEAGAKAEAGLQAPGPVEPSGFQSWRQRRMARWDRPPDPHDWRFFVGGVGKILIVTGLLMFGFVAYQLWGTGIETARAQNDLAQQFERLLEANRQSAPVTAAPATSAPTVPASSVTPATAPPATGVPGSTSPSVLPSAAPTSPPTTSAPAAPAAPAPRPTRQRVERGQVLFRLEIPRMGKTDGDALYVVPGVALSDLKHGPGHYPDTPLPGELGNASIAGHRTTWGEPFRHIDELQPGDDIIVTMLDGQQYVYVVTGTEIVGPSDYYVVTTQDPDVAMLTLTSCHPVFTSKQRIAVHAVLDPSRSGVVTPPTFYELDDTQPAEETTADTPSVTPPTATVAATPSATGTPTIATSSTPTAVVTGEPPGTGTPAGAVTPTSTGPEAAADVSGGDGVLPVDRETVGDAFGQGWFHDRAAFPQIALWGAVLIAIALLAYRVARRFRRVWVGCAVGAVPFVVCLYFFYQNVNRLLPPGL